MALYAVAERRLRPGALSSYLDAMRAVDAYLINHPHRGPYSMYVAEGEPDVLLGVGLWRRREDLEAAAALLPRPLVDALQSTVADGEGRWEWFDSARQRRAYTGAPRHFAATRMQVAEEHIGNFRRWFAEAQDRVIRIEGVLTLHMLESPDRAGEFLHLSEYAHTEARDRALAGADASRPTFPFNAVRRYVGRLGHYWDRDEARGDAQAS